MKKPKLKIFLDIDDCVFGFNEAFAKRYNQKSLPKTWSSSKLMIKRLNELKKDKQYWLNLPIKNKPNFIPNGYVSARSIPVSWTKESLSLNKIPGRSTVLQVPWNVSKLETLQNLGCDIFVDDKPQTFLELNKAGMFCLLMDASHNKSIETDLRIDNLNIESILKMYRKYKFKM